MFEISEVMDVKKLALFVAATLLCALFSSCGARREKYSAQTFECFDTITTLIGYADSKDEFDKVCDTVFTELEAYHHLYDIYEESDGNANLHTVNSLAGDAEGIVVDQRIIDLLLFGREMYDLTDGRVNIAMGSVLSLWHAYRIEGIDHPEQAMLPPMSELEAAAEHTDISKMAIDEENQRVALLDPQMSLDVGAIAKGYAVECVARMLREQGVTGYIINAGGNVATIGTRDDGTPWSVGIESPSQDEGYLAILSLSGQSLVTSGSYQRFYTVDGIKYHHIIDPDTLMPSAGLLSVSVVCHNSAQADALSTALFCMTAEEGMAMVEKMDGVEAIWMRADGTILKTTDFEKYCEEDV